MSSQTDTPTPTPTVQKGRKGAAASGGKVWTEEEEVYLLQMRLERVAYKKIAAHLQKTELACRLHYHQLSHGGNRRKRNTSVSSTSTSSQNSPTTSPCTETSKVKFPGDPSPRSSFSPINGAGAIQKVGSLNSQKIKGKPLLPKPSDPASARVKAAANKLRLNCGHATIDKERLRQIVKKQEKQFWDSVASQYGDSIDSEFLRDFWQADAQHTKQASSPPTPDFSPASKAASPIPADLSPEGSGNTVTTVSEVSTPVNAQPSPTFKTEVDPIREESMEDCPHEDEPKEEFEQAMASSAAAAAAAVTPMPAPVHA